MQDLNVTDVDSLFVWFDSLTMVANKKILVEVVVCNTLWMLWRYRNDVVHEAKMMRKSLLVDSIREISFC